MIIAWIWALLLIISVLMCIIGIILIEFDFKIGDTLINYGLVILLAVISLTGIAILFGILLEIGGVR